MKPEDCGIGKREIKFRAWEGSEMLPWSHLQTVGGWESCCMGDFFDGEYILMQYTGLKDKNGKEIYEGDVVTFVGDKFGDNSWVVIYSHGSFGVKSVRTGLITYSFAQVDLRETPIGVVGNIFDDLQLLNS